MMVLSRMLPPAAYGTYRQVWLILLTLGPVLELGIPPSASFYAPKLDRPALKRYLAQNGLVLLASGTLLGLCFATLGGPLAKLFDNSDLVLPLRAFALYPALTLPFNLVENTLVARNRAGTAGIVSAVSVLGQNIAVLIPLLAGGTLVGSFAALSGWAALRWLLALGAYLAVLRDVGVGWSLRELRSQIAFALPLGASFGVGLLGRQLDKVIVSSNFGPEQFAVYANGAYQIPLVSVLTMSVTSVLVPAIVRARSDGKDIEVIHLWHGAARRMAAIFFPAFCALFVLAEPAMVLLFSETYRASAVPFRIFLFILPLRIAFYSGLLRAIGRTKAVLLAAAGSVAVTVVLALPLVKVPQLGPAGPALASTAGQYFAAAYAAWVASRHLGWSMRQFFPWGALGRIMLASALAAAPAALAASLAANHGIAAQILLGLGVYAISYALLSHWTGAYRFSEWKRIFSQLLAMRP